MRQLEKTSEGVIFVSQYETLLLELLRRLDEKADRIAVALEKMSPPGGQDREAIERIVDDRVKRMLSDSLPGDLRPAESRKKLADTIRGILTEQVQVSSSQQQPFPTERTPNQGEELHPDEASRRSDTPLHP